MSDLPESIKIFWSDKKKKNYQELSVTFKIGVERNKIGRMHVLLEEKKKTTANLNITAERHKKTVYDLQEKRGVELEKEEDGEHSAQTELTQSMCLQSELLLTAIVFSQAIIGQETFLTPHSSNMLKRSGTIPIELLRMLTTNVLPAMVATYVLHHVTDEWMLSGPRFK